MLTPDPRSIRGGPRGRDDTARPARRMRHRRVERWGTWAVAAVQRQSRSAADPQTVRELLETRRLLEPTAAQLAAVGNRSPALEKLRETLKAEQEQLDDEFALTVTNMHFHAAVGRLSGSSILAETIDALVGSYTEEQREILLLYDDRKKDYDEHRRILEAIASGDGEFAYRQMYEHLTGVIEKVARRAARSQGEGNH